MMKFHSKTGYTLIELMVVVGIIGLIAAFAVPSMLKMKPHYDLKNAASDVSGAMTNARMKSILEHQDYTLAFDKTADSFTSQPAGGAATTLSQEWRGIDIYNDTSDANVKFFTGNKVVFRSDGTADIASVSGYEAVYLKHKPDTGERYRVSVLGSTGRIKMEHWTGGTWKSGY